jgi:hypothetical protein
MKKILHCAEHQLGLVRQHLWQKAGKILYRIVLTYFIAAVFSLFFGDDQKQVEISSRSAKIFRNAYVFP